jgi:alpha-aminoadipate carrier protein LysW
LRRWRGAVQTNDATAGERMATCPECDAEIEVDEFDVDKGDLISCPDCGSNLEVTSTSPLELEPAEEDDEDDDDDDDDEEKDGDDEDDFDDVDEGEDDSDGEDWEE